MLKLNFRIAFVAMFLSFVYLFYSIPKITHANNWTLSGTELYNNNVGNVGTNIIPPQSVFHVGDGNSVINTGLGLGTGNFVLTNEGTKAGIQGIVASSEASRHSMNLEGVRASSALAVPTTPMLGDSVLTLTGKIFDGNVAQDTARIAFVVDNEVSAGVAPQRISFSTGQTDAASSRERLLITGNGQVIIPGSVGIGTGSAGGLLGLSDANTYLNVDSNGNLTFTDLTAGTKTLAQLAAEGIEAETDPFFSASTASGITGIDVANWNAAYTWAAQSSTAGNPGIIQPAGITTTNYVQKWAGTAITDSAIYDNNGSIGIGTTNSSYSLEVISAGNNNTKIKNSSAGASNSTVIDLFNDGFTSFLSFGINSTSHWDANSAFFWSFYNYDMKFVTNNVERVRIKNDGKVGIGTTVPTSSLEVLGTAPKFTTDNGSALMNIVGYGGAANPLNGVRIDSSRGSLALPAPVLAGDRLGRIGFGGMPNAGGTFVQPVMIEGTATENWSATGHGGKLQFFTTANGTATPPTERMVIGHDGRIGVNTTTPQSVFHIGDGNNTISASLGINTGRFVFARQGGTGGIQGIVVSSGAPGHRMNFEVSRARGTLASPTVPLLNDSVITLNGKIFDGSIVQNTADVTFYVDGPVSSGVAPQRISFSTGATNAASKAERLVIKSNGQVHFLGNVAIGTTTPNPAAVVDVNGPIYQRGGVLHADYVFEPDYELESIEEHAEYMWKNKHLKAIPRAKVDSEGKEMVEVGSHRRGIVEELEKAHIYIARLEERFVKVDGLKAENKSLKEHSQSLEARLSNIEKGLINSIKPK